jgi:hypothetical protein
MIDAAQGLVAREFSRERCIVGAAMNAGVFDIDSPSDGRPGSS